MNNQKCLSLTKVGNNGEEDLLFALMRMYAGDNRAGDDDVAAKLRTFNGIKTQEFEMQWLVQYVLRLYCNFETTLEE